MSKTLKEYIKTILKNIDKGVEKNRKDKLIELAQTIKNTYKNENKVRMCI